MAMRFYEVFVFGCDFEGVPSEGGWQLAIRTTSKDEAVATRDKYISLLGVDNVDWVI